MELRNDPTSPKISASDYWRMSKVAWESGHMEKFFDLDPVDQAWLVAYYETEQLLNAVIAKANELK